MLKSVFAPLLVFVTLLNSTAWAESPKAKYGPEATPLSLSHHYFEKAAAPHFWTLIPYYVHQQFGWSCSLASVAMLMNALRVGAPLTSEDKLVTQTELLKRVHHPAWEKNEKGIGYGVSLDQLGSVIEASLKEYQIKNAKVEVVHADNASDGTKKKLHDALISSEKKGGGYIIANFIQGSFTGDANIGHIAPIGAYDSENKKVLILDPDREWYEPYWVSEATLLKGMATPDLQSMKNRGYVLITMPERQ
jgi:hypothetical protein